MNWSYLPSEILFAVLRQIDLRSLLRCSSICKNWRFNVLDDHLWENLYHIDYQFDNTVPYDNQAWRTFYIRKSKVFKAIQYGNAYIKTLIANHEAHLENKFIGPSVSMFKDNVITTWGSQAIGSLNLKVLGCHVKNIYTEEVSKQLGKSWYSKAIGEYLLSFNVDGLSFRPEWHTLNATKISPDISDMKFSSDRNIPWDDRPYKVAIFNDEPTCTQLICVDQRFGNAVLYDWSTKEKKELSALIVGTPIAFHKSTIVTKTRDVVRVYMNDELLHQSSVENEIQFAQMNDTLLVCATIHYIWIFDRRNNYEHFKFKHERSFPLFLFDDLLVYRHGYGLAFYNVNARNIIGTVFYRGQDVRHVIRHSPNEFLVQTNDTIMLLNFETKPNNISVMHVADNGELKEITIKSSNLLDFAVDALKTTAGNIESCYVMKKPGGKRYIMLFNGKPNKRAKTNVKANELIREYFRVVSGYVYMPFCPYTTDPANITADLHKRVTLDRDVVITGDVIIYCEQIVNEKTERVKPDKWPTELYTKTAVEENNKNNNQNNYNKKSKKKK